MLSLDTGAPSRECLREQRLPGAAAESPTPARPPRSTSDNAPLATLLAADSTVAVETIDSPRKALLGGTWTTAAGFSLMGEAWWDGTAPAAGDWQRLARQAAQRTALLGVPGVPAAAVAGATAASTRIFDQGNLARRGLLARLAWSEPGGGMSASVDMLRSLDDGGWILTTALAWQGERLRLDAGLRRYGGPTDSAYRLLPERAALYVGVSVAYLPGPRIAAYWAPNRSVVCTS